MEFLIQPKAMWGHRLYTNIVTIAEDNETFIVQWELRTHEVRKVIDRGIWTLPIAYLPLFSVVKPDAEGYVQNDPALRAQINAILSDPGIEMVLAEKPDGGQ